LTMKTNRARCPVFFQLLAHREQRRWSGGPSLSLSRNASLATAPDLSAQVMGSAEMFAMRRASAGDHGSFRSSGLVRLSAACPR